MSPRKSNVSADAVASGGAPVPVGARFRARVARRAGEVAALLRAVGRSVPMAGWVFVVCFLVYSHRPLVQSSMDNQPLRWGAALLASQGTLNFANMGIDASRFYSMRTMPDGSIRSHTPIGTALLGAPVFWAARKLGMEFTSENVVFLDAFAAALDRKSVV